MSPPSMRFLQGYRVFIALCDFQAVDDLCKSNPAASYLRSRVFFSRANNRSRNMAIAIIRSGIHRFGLRVGKTVG